MNFFKIVFRFFFQLNFLKRRLPSFFSIFSNARLYRKCLESFLSIRELRRDIFFLQKLNVSKKNLSVFLGFS